MGGMQRPRSSSLPANARFCPCMPNLTKRESEEKSVVPALCFSASSETFGTHKTASLTTVVVMGLPRCIDLEGFLAVVKSLGFGEAWDLVNLPEDRAGGKNR